MIYPTLIIECGGSNWEYALLKGRNSDVQLGIFKGYNPYSHDRHVLESNLLKTSALSEEHIKRVIFYGAGVDDTVKNLIHNLIDRVFPKAEIKIYSDLMAVSDGIANGDPGWMGILGTGSNLSYWDGQAFTISLPSFGYLLGDEGSGRSILREVMKSFYRDEFSPELTSKLSSIFTLSYVDILNEIYDQPGWTMSSKDYMKSIRSFWADPEIQIVAKKELNCFLEKQVHLALNKMDGPLFLVGSVAYAYKDYICSWWKNNSDQPIQIRSSAIQSLIELYKNER